MAAIERIFLSWESSFLHQVSDWLLKRYTEDASCDLSRVCLVTSGGRSGRRLQEILSKHKTPLIYSGPKLLSVGDLPEYLYDQKKIMEGNQVLELASPLESQLVMMDVLRQSEDFLQNQLFKILPKQGDFLAWHRLSKEILSLINQLAADLVSLEDAIATCDQMPGWNDQSRWAAIQVTHYRYQERLLERGKIDPNTARFKALSEKLCGAEQDIVMVGTADLKLMSQKLLYDAGQQTPRRITCLIYAGAKHQAGFNAIGCLDLAYWDKQHVSVADDVLKIVDKPADQAMAIVDCLAQDPAQHYPIDQITIGLGDEQLSGIIQRTLDLGQIPARSAVGRLATQTRGPMLLDAIAQWVAKPTAQAFADLLRHPDIEIYLRNLLKDKSQHSQDVLDLLDHYLSDHLPRRITNHWLGDPDRAEHLGQIYRAINAIIERPHSTENVSEPMALGQFSGVIQGILCRVYDGIELDPERPEDQVLIRSLGSLATLLREQSLFVGRENSLGGALDLSSAIFFTLSRMENQMIPQQTESSAIEILGYLELASDDAQRLIITGFNEGFVPGSMDAHPFLPDHFRSILGLEDNHRRLIRDKYYLASILGGQRKVNIICGKRTAAGDPLMPSRLLLTGQTDEIISRIGRFYDHEEGAEDGRQDENHLLLNHGSHSQFKIPLLAQPDEKISTLSVTGFKDYLDCPYRFYLKHLLKLRAVDDDAVEIDGMQFGNLIHGVLQRFGQSDLADQTQTTRIEKFLFNETDRLIAEKYGRKLNASVAIQVIGMKERLGEFAAWQAQQSQQGWRILPQYLEYPAQAVLQVQDQEVTVVGRIDRIDFHAERGYRIIDYKTSDQGDSPEKTHRSGTKNHKKWIDLQLPLYYLMCQSLPLTPQISMGYVVLPSDLNRASYLEADWDVPLIEDGIAEAKRVAGLILDGVFWPPKSLTAQRKPYDLFGGICLENCSGQDNAIAFGNAQLAERGAR